MNAETRRKLRELAEAATGFPGPWTREDGRPNRLLVYDGHGGVVAEMGTGSDRMDALADMVSMLNPGVVIEMLDALEEAEKRAGRLQADYDNACIRVGEHLMNGTPL